MTTLPDIVMLDSSCWIEFFLGTPAAATYAPAVTSARLVVPTITIFEVTRDLLRRFENDDVLQAISFMQQHDVVPLTEAVATTAAQLSVHLRLSSADAIICATAWQHRATLYTHDADLNGLDNVVYTPRLQHTNDIHT